MGFAGCFAWKSALPYINYFIACSTQLFLVTDINKIIQPTNIFSLNMKGKRKPGFLMLKHHL